MEVGCYDLKGGEKNGQGVMGLENKRTGKNKAIKIDGETDFYDPQKGHCTESH